MGELTGARSEDQKLLLIFTNTYDMSVNRIVDKIGSKRVFRFNFDIWQDYEIRIGPTDFEIVNPMGFAVTRHDVAKAYWRKPISRFFLEGHRVRPIKSILRRAVDAIYRTELYPPRMTAQERYLEAEMDYAIGEIRNLLWKEKKLVLVEPASHGRLGKLVQLDIAGHYFRIPAYEFVFEPHATERESRPRIVKSLSGERLGSNAFMWTSAINEADLDRQAPWFVQDLVRADRDVTIVHIRGQNFAFDLDRATFVDKSVDWREVGDLTTPLWRPCILPEELGHKVNAYMAEVGLNFGRLDFLLEGETYWFLEVNSNGEWGWLDFDGSRGILRTLVRRIAPGYTRSPNPSRSLQVCHECCAAFANSRNARALILSQACFVCRSVMSPVGT